MEYRYRRKGRDIVGGNKKNVYEGDTRLKKRLTIYSMRRNWVVKYDDTWRDIFQKVGKELGVPVGDVERISSAWWRYVGEILGRVDLPRIRFTYWMVMKPSETMLLKYCRYSARMIEDLKIRRLTGEVVKADIDKMEDHLGKLERSYDRIVKERKESRRNSDRRFKVGDPVRTGLKMLYNRIKKRNNEKK